MDPGADSQALDLVTGFRYVHEPLATLDDSMPSLGHAELRQELVERLRRSTGGAMLVGGFRGAGKTSLVRQATNEAITAAPDNTWIVIQLDVARPLSTTDLLYTIMRRLYEELDDRGVLARLGPKIRDAVGLAYLRTSASVATKKSEERERTTTVGTSSFPAGLSAVLAGLTPKLERASKRTDSLSTDVAFLTYADSDVEHDFLRIISLLRTTPLRSPTWWGRWRGHTDPPVRVIVILDELDKLTDDPAGPQCLDELLASLKNILATSGVYFIFVAGADLLDRALTDSEHGNGLFESVFAWNAYVPCLWAGPRRLIEGVVRPRAGQEVAQLQGYLEYKARGIPRRLFQEINAFVRWDGDSAQLRFTPTDLVRMRFYARLNEVLESYVGTHTDLADEDFGVELDRFRLGAHYVLDWVLRSEGGVFVADDVLNGPRSLSPLLGMSSGRVDGQLAFLAEHDILERLTEPSSPFHTIIADSLRASAQNYRLAKQVRIDLLDITRADPRERADLLGQPERPATANGASAPAPETPYGHIYGEPFPPYPSTGPPSYPQPPSYAQSYAPSPATTWPPQPAPPPTAPYQPPPPSGPYPPTLGPGPDTGSGSARPADWAVPRNEQLIGSGRYELVDVVGVGGMGTVYRARDLVTTSEVAIKLLSSGSLRDPAMRARFMREAQIGASLQLPGVARTLDVLEEPDGRLGIVMEFLDGTSLAAIAPGELDASDAVRIVADLLATIGRIHAQGIVRLDIKPDNIMLNADRQPIVLDLGLARPIYEKASVEVTGVSTLVGTPAFMAPEQITGGTIDGRTDVYSAACVLFQLLGGDLARESNAISLLARRMNEPHLPTAEVDCSDELRDFIATATARSPDDRFADADRARAALLTVPEAGRPDPETAGP